MLTVQYRLKTDPPQIHCRTVVIETNCPDEAERTAREVCGADHVLAVLTKAELARPLARNVKRITPGNFVTVTKDEDGEFRVPGPDGREASAYYTDSRIDALHTARAMYGGGVTVHFRSLP